MVNLLFFNTLGRKKQEFKPIGEEVRMYHCGPTVYNYPHIGNYRAYVFADFLRRVLEHKGYAVKQVMNITDVDDKTIRGSKKESIPLKEFTARYEKAFFEDLKALNIKPAHAYPHATQTIPEMVALVQKLLDKGIAYNGGDGSVYYKISAFKGYGKLSGLKLDELEEGASGRVKKDEYTKEHASDFVLWKAWDEDDGDVFWDTPLGKGRPGWHIECSAMSAKYLGQPFDIHTGGVDLIFPHHENEIAQSEGAYGKQFAKYWMHNEHLLVDGRKMAKSLGNFYTLRDVIEKGYDARAVRFLLVSTHYRSQLNFTFDALKAAENTLKRLNEFVERLRQVREGKENKALGKALEETKKKFNEALEDDLDSSNALAAVFGLEKEANRAMDAGALDEAQAKEVLEFMLKDFDAVFGVLEEEKEFAIPSEVKLLIEEREKARKNKDFKRSDELRQKIKALGFVVEDGKKGATVKKA